MNGFLINIEKATLQNENFRKVLKTAQNSQRVVMSLLPEGYIGTEFDDNEYGYHKCAGLSMS
jgi:ABC-type oligopeptide transport system substrate-binding subunit